ncbi:MAG: thioredoxin family protein [Desulfosarcina sp.]
MNGRRLAHAALLTVLLTLSAAAGQLTMAGADGGGIQWLSYAEGRQRGEAEKKKLFLFFDSERCRYCLQMERETFSNSAVIAFVNRNFIPIRVNSDKEQKTALKYQVRGLPSIWFISETGERIANRPGYIAADEMLNILRYIESDSHLSMSFKSFLEKDAAVN